MRLHTDNTALTTGTITTLFHEERQAGRILPGAGFKLLAGYRSNSHHHAVEIQLEADRYQPGRRRGNSGSYGPMTDGSYAVTYDEWGWLIARIYQVDPKAVFGPVGCPNYRDALDFHEQTGQTYDPESLLLHLRHWTDPFPYVSRHPQVGRLGYGRKRTNPDGYLLELPRTIEQMLAFAHLGTEAVPA